ncbi:MAG: sodium:calcium antiporter [Acholeplasmatales bacterium]|nr:MAG: sodium:calcium antiporter [Acholeplasmatales bacterium]
MSLIAGYLLLAMLTIYSTQKASHFINELDKKTAISGALIGGVVLASVTSLPELITSLTATVGLDNPGLAFGNVFGSNMFNLLILAVVDLIFIRHYFYNQTNSGIKTSGLILVMYAIFIMPLVLMLFTSLGYTSFDMSWLGTVSLLSVAILIVYVFAIRAMGEELPPEKPEGGSRHSLKAIIWQFMFWAVLVIVSAYFITVVTDRLAIRYQLSASFAGAIFLGVATSLPELTAVITLFKLRNYAVALGGILGSSVFNMMIISLVDVVYLKDSIYRDFTHDVALLQNISLLLILGFINSIIVLVALKRKPTHHTWWYAAPSITIIVSYIIYIAFSV